MPTRETRLDDIVGRDVFGVKEIVYSYSESLSMEPGTCATRTAPGHGILPRMSIRE